MCILKMSGAQHLSLGLGYKAKLLSLALLSGDDTLFELKMLNGYTVFLTLLSDFLLIRNNEYN